MRPSPGGCQIRPVRRLVVDTDVGTDVDDLYVLAMLPHLPDTEVVAITTVYGDTALRARLASVACRGLGLDAPIAAGRELPLSGRAVHWAGWEGEGVDGLDGARFADDVAAVDLLVDLGRRHGGELDVVAIGPLTNVAAALATDPSFATNVRRLTWMGGHYGGTRVEHNASCDAVATARVLTSGMAVTACGYEWTTRVSFDDGDVDRIERGSPIGPLVADQTRRYRAGRGVTINSPHDPVALLTLVRPDLFRTERVAVDVTTEGPDAGLTRAVPDATSPVEVVRDADLDAVREAILALLATSSGPGG